MKIKYNINGRNRIIEVLPLNFWEYLQFEAINISKVDAHIREAEFENFLKTAGIRQPRVLRDHFLLLMKRAGNQFSLNKTASVPGVSVDPVTRYVELFRRVYLIYDRSSWKDQ